MFGKIFVPDAVYRELVHPTAPPPLRQWAGHRPRWLEIRTVASREDEALRPLGVGERDAIALAMSLHTDLVPIDDRKGTKAALTKGLEVTGTPGILRVAARLGSVNLADSFERLKRTNFRYRQEIVDRLLAEQSGEVSG